MDKYKNILFENPRPFIIIKLENNRLIINETNINYQKNTDISLEHIKENIDVKGLVKDTLENSSENRRINFRGKKFNLSSKKVGDNEVVVWFDIEENLYDLSKANFLSNLTHEFKTPLNLIFSSVQLLNKKMQNNKNILYDDIEKYLNIINQNSYRILKLINNISDDNKIDLGYSNYSPINANIIYFIEDICESIEPFVKSNNMKIVFDTDIEELVVSFDMEKMERIILNLISNAVKFRKSSGGKIILSITHDNDFVNIKVNDNGIGISKDNLNKIFEKYVRLNDKRSIIKEGTGIGLSLVKSLVKLHGGEVTVDSEIEKWTEFNIKIPNITCVKKYIDTYDKDLNREDKIKIEFSDIYA